MTSNDEDEERWAIENEIKDKIDRAEHIHREAKKALVFFFEMRILFSHPKIETIFKEFGQNIPEYLQYEGGSCDGMTVVCCVDSSINAKTICLQNCVSYTKLSELEIDEMKYRNSNRVSCGYCGLGLAKGWSAEKLEMLVTRYVSKLLKAKLTTLARNVNDVA